MPTLNIKNPRVYDLASILSKETGQSMTSVIELALERMLAERRRPKAGTAERILELAARTAPLLKDLPADPFEDLYDPNTGGPL